MLTTVKLFKPKDESTNQKQNHNSTCQKFKSFARSLFNRYMNFRGISRWFSRLPKKQGIVVGRRPCFWSKSRRTGTSLNRLESYFVNIVRRVESLKREEPRITAEWGMGPRITDCPYSLIFSIYPFSLSIMFPRNNSTNDETR